MAIISKRKISVSSQLRYAVGYLLITAVVLVFLNVYTAATMRNLAFSAQENSMLAKARLLSSSLGSTEELNEEIAAQTINTTENVRVSRILVTDQKGIVVFDSDDSQLGKFFLIDEIQQALENKDVLTCKYNKAVLDSCAAMPIYYGTKLIGTVCLMDQDAEQGAMIDTLQVNILRVSVVLAVMILCFSLFFSAAYSRRMRRILQTVRIVREGDYSAQIAIRGDDELTGLALEFNQLTSRLQTSEQKRRQFVSDASHELKTPLASIKLLADSILQNEMDAQTTREFVSDISGESDRLTRLTQKLLELTKIDSRVAEDLSTIDVAQIVGRVVRMLTPLAEQKCVSIDVHVPEGCTIRVQGDDLYQIIFNLVENGIKYNKYSGWLGISASHTDESVILTVSDTGVGIPDDAMDQIFERFYRVDKARSRAAGGSGLGLSIVHDMVQRNGGTISVSHRNREGTCFTVAFPYVP